MSEPTSHICPECSTPRASDGTPSCVCGRRASEALLEARTAEAAAAEDFDPLRIRPYVELGHENQGRPGGPPHPTAPGGDTPGPDQASTIALPVTTAAPGTAATTALTPLTPPTTALPTTAATGPDPASGRTFGRRGGRPGWARDPGGSGSRSAGRAASTATARRRRRRAGLVIALAGTAATAVMAAAGFASGLFSYNAPERDRALPDDLRASVPDTSPDGAASPVEPSAKGGGEAPAPVPPDGGAASPSPSRTASSSPSPTEPSGSPSASASASPSPSAPSASASTGSSAAGADESNNSRLVVPKTLRLGDDDPEVTELQLRLRQLGFYDGDIDQNFDSRVEQAVLDYQDDRGITKGMDEPGVYGLITRERLESETKEP
ncbi:peptidoglycan-binding domain-containing protein [Streptomyces griseiscabiei]|uniref:Peptidoglycan-binding domain-containing protein n=1 Tax=Streptomyces griseiscabiei TaxID=2993540 RepID=A0ABU4KWI5_9ACTN|nr:peptidoglycan-binding domain-containing protein [Streptomyces griseiscabiei]MBZ3903413.1 peptidoglycan-binding protein [Streptomyces griseiscabiei]MDX2907726.1 peptidoglycan-binding domain-containing protein [Streptomyces griseiscabiei]